MDVARVDETQGEHLQSATRDLEEPNGSALEVENRAKMANAEDNFYVHYLLFFNLLREMHYLP